jgi:hypothetical protein
MESDQELMDKARKRTSMKLGFYVNLAIFIIVNAFLYLIWWYSGQGFLWPLIVTFFWGMGLIAYGLRVYGSGRYTEGMVQKEYERLKEEKK